MKQLCCGHSVAAMLNYLSPLLFLRLKIENLAFPLLLILLHKTVSQAVSKFHTQLR